MWYHYLQDLLLAKGFDLNLIGTNDTCKYAEHLLTTVFDMKILGRTTFCLGLQVHHSPDGSILFHQQNYTRKLLKTFQMEQAHPLAAPMIGRSCTTTDPYRPCCKEEEVIDKDKYLASVGALIYLATHTRPNISFDMSILARHNQKPTARHWNKIKHLM